MAVRFLIAAVVVVLLSGAATYLLARNEIHKLVEALERRKAIKVDSSLLPTAYQGGPETLLLVGNDERRHTTTAPVLPHSNEMLARADRPNKPTIAMLSIPRELWVPIDKPDGVIEENRINAAFQFGWEGGGGTAGGVNLMLKTIKQVMGLTVNHVFITNFNKFKNAVDAMGCVYMTVDKRYYHNNAIEPEQYMEINLQPGYQRLCGQHALEFVANRHESTSLIRDARDQRFLLEVKAQFGGNLFENREKFERIMGRTVETDEGLHSEAQVLELLKLLISAAGKPVRQVHFHVTQDPTFDTATQEQIDEAVSSFLKGTSKLNEPRLRVRSRHSRHRHRSPPPPPPAPLTPTPNSTIAAGIGIAPHLPFTVEVPRGQVTTAEAEPDAVRRYSIAGPERHSYPAYVIVVSTGEVGEYYDVQGSAWGNSPLLENTHSEIHVGSRTYGLYYAGEHLKTIAWHEGGAAYWIENTLSNSLSPNQMLAIAETTLPVAGTVAKSVFPSVRLNQQHHLPNWPPPPSPGVPRMYREGALVGFGGLGLVALLFPFALLRARKLRRLRGEVAETTALEERQRAQLIARARRPAAYAPPPPATAAARAPAPPRPPTPPAPAAAAAQASAPLPSSGTGAARPPVPPATAASPLPPTAALTEAMPPADGSATPPAPNAPAAPPAAAPAADGSPTPPAPNGPATPPAAAPPVAAPPGPSAPNGPAAEAGAGSSPPLAGPAPAALPGAGPPAPRPIAPPPPRPMTPPAPGESPAGAESPDASESPATNGPPGAGPPTGEHPPAPSRT